MARTLSLRDIELLKQMAPEFAGEECSITNAPYKSLLTPISRHYATDADDFIMRVEKLSLEDLQYLCDIIISGEESLHCMPPECFISFVKYVKKSFGGMIAAKVTATYANVQSSCIRSRPIYHGN